mgnify:CR=1 FL=1
MKGFVVELIKVVEGSGPPKDGGALLLQGDDTPAGCDADDGVALAAACPAGPSPGTGLIRRAFYCFQNQLKEDGK